MTRSLFPFKPVYILCEMGDKDTIASRKYHRHNHIQTSFRISRSWELLNTKVLLNCKVHPDMFIAASV